MHSVVVSGGYQPVVIKELLISGGMTRQNVARLTAEAVIEQRGDGHYDQTASRLRYIKHLREQHRHSPRSAADAAHVAVKTEMLQLRLINIPATPHKVYVDDGWVGIGDWLGTGRIAPGQFRSFDEARTFARGLGLKSAAEWYAFSKSGNKPTDIPIWPHASYRHVGGYKTSFTFGPPGAPHWEKRIITEIYYRPNMLVRAGEEARSAVSNHEAVSQIRLRAQAKFSCAFKLIWAVQSRLQKDFASGLTQIKSISIASRPTQRGVSRSSRT